MAAETLTCSHCGKEGHLIRNCWKKLDENKSKSTGAHDKQKNKESIKVKTGEQKWCVVYLTTTRKAMRREHHARRGMTTITLHRLLLY